MSSFSQTRPTFILPVRTKRCAYIQIIHCLNRPVGDFRKLLLAVNQMRHLGGATMRCVPNEEDKYNKIMK